MALKGSRETYVHICPFQSVGRITTGSSVLRFFLPSGGTCFPTMTRVAEVCHPESYVEVTKNANWRAVIEEEMHALLENKTSDLVDAPKGVKQIGCRWVNKVKYNTDGSVNQYKARLVAKGYA